MVIFIDGKDTERRVVKRKVLQYPIQFKLPDGSLARGRISNISNDGAGFTLASDGELPQDLNMMLSEFNGQHLRACRKVWQNDRNVGVEFVKEADAKEKRRR